MALYSTYLVWYFTDRGVPVWLAIVLAMAISFIGGALIERIVIRPVEHASPLVLVIVTIGLFLALNSIAQVQFGTDIKLLAARVSRQDVAARQRADLGDTLVLVGVLVARVRAALPPAPAHEDRSRRSAPVASNPESSRLRRRSRSGAMLMLGWAHGGRARRARRCARRSAPARADRASSMQSILVFAFAAAALGGFDSPLGAVVGGLIVGVAEHAHDAVHPRPARHRARRAVRAHPRSC